ncbi:MAG: mechanosensitive ion channel protein MscS [Tenericutes bacterium HGW-Tenericutes-3]|nr:MAG: mechanosensitive ion channel protein MscS [Tenericutes bacterium HGW-Tenericutes-3]
MLSNILFTSVALNVGLTITLLILIILLGIFEKKWLKKREADISKWLIVIIYLISFIVLVASTVFLLFIWNFDISTHIDKILTNGQALIDTSIAPLINSIIIIFVSMTILKVAKVGFTHISTKDGPLKKRKQTITKVLNSIVKYLVSIIAILVVLALWGVNVAPALAGLGILGLVIGLGAQKFINDLISGFFIVFEHHFDVGDKIEVQGFKGDVTDIGLKTTRIRNWKGDVKIISNGEISSLINFSRNFSIAVAEFGIAYKEDVQKTIDLLKLELPKMRPDFPVMIEDPQVLGVIELASSGVNLRVIAKTISEQHYAIERELRKRIKQILDENGIEIPFPQVVVHQPKE